MSQTLDYLITDKILLFIIITTIVVAAIINYNTDQSNNCNIYVPSEQLVQKKCTQKGYNTGYIDIYNCQQNQITCTKKIGTYTQTKCITLISYNNNNKYIRKDG